MRAGLDIIAAIGPLETRAERVEVRVADRDRAGRGRDLISGGAREPQRAMVGEYPNIAARLQGLAEPGAVTSPIDASQLLGDLFILRPWPPEVARVSLKPSRWSSGRSRVELRQRAGSRRRVPRARWGLLARKAEIEFALMRQHRCGTRRAGWCRFPARPGSANAHCCRTLSESLALGTHRRIRVSVLALPHEQRAPSLCRPARARCRHRIAGYIRAKARQA